MPYITGHHGTCKWVSIGSKGKLPTKSRNTQNDFAMHLHVH
jgi:hypothetical protein